MKAPTQRFVDRFAQIYTPAVLAIAALIAVVPPLFLNGAWGEWVYKALVLLVIACPCALVISTPVSIVSGLAAAALAGFVGAFAGAWAVTVLSPDFLRKLLPLVLLAVLAYTLAKKDLGRHHVPRFAENAEWIAACAIGLSVGFYDGFFGPGTGSFFVFLFVRWLGYDFLNASASAKLLNVSTNIAALILFTYKGHVWWHFALPLAVANVVGSVLGTHMALKHGTGFVRWIFIFVVSILILKTGYDAFLR